MRFNHPKATLRTTALAVLVLLLGASWAVAQQQINLTAGPTTITMPDGASVPMWGYSCGAVVTGSTATCAKSNPTAAGWSPVVITVPTGQTLQINLTNSLTFGGNSVPTSLTIVGQLGGGLGTAATTTPSPAHAVQTLTWPASSTDPTDPTNTPPPQEARVQSFSTEVAAGATTALTWTTPRPGTYLLESGTHPSIQGPMGLYGMVVVTDAATGTAYPAAGATPAVTYNADASFLFSEIDPVQNNAVSTAVNTAGFSETMVWSGQPGGCGNPSSATYHQCYPPAVNYTPGITSSTEWLSTGPIHEFAVPNFAGNWSCWNRVGALGECWPADAHSVDRGRPNRNTPAVSGFGLIAEDGNPLPGVRRIQNEVFMAAGKTYDVMMNVPAAAATALPIFDRQGVCRATRRRVTPGCWPTSASTARHFQPSSWTRGCCSESGYIQRRNFGQDAHRVGSIQGRDRERRQCVRRQGPGCGTRAHAQRGRHLYLPAPPTTFNYCGNGATSGPACSTVTLDAATVEAASGITPNDDAYTSAVGSRTVKPALLSIKPPGILGNDTDAAKYPLSVALGSDPPVPSAGLTLSVNPDGSFTASVTTAGTYTFTYKAVNSQGTVSANSATVTLTFPTANGPTVTLVDGRTKAPLSPQDYRWIIEEDRTFYVDPNCQTNPLPSTCPLATPQGTPAIFGTNFHTSYMPVVAQGCVGTTSCESGQSVSARQPRQRVVIRTGAAGLALVCCCTLTDIRCEYRGDRRTLPSAYPIW